MLSIASKAVTNQASAVPANAVVIDAGAGEVAIKPTAAAHANSMPPM